MHTSPPKTLAQDGGEDQKGAECAVCSVHWVQKVNGVVSSDRLQRVVSKYQRLQETHVYSSNASPKI